MFDNLTDAVLLEFSDKYSGDAKAGVAVFGSFANGLARVDSDVDLSCYTSSQLERPEDRLTIQFINDRMVCLLISNIAELENGLQVPERAIWAVPGFRKARILRDLDGRLREMKLRAESFTWSDMQSAADHYASHRMMKFAEEAFKLAAAVRRVDQERILTEATWLMLGLPLVVAVQKGIFLENETRLPSQVNEVLGTGSSWGSAYRATAGYGAKPEGLAVTERGLGAIRLYLETARLLDEVLRPEHRTTVLRTCDECISVLEERQ